MQKGAAGLSLRLTEMREPEIKRAVSFIDGQNLFRHAMEAFGYYFPNYDPHKLSNAVCSKHGWINHGVRFYTGVPDASWSSRWHQYWQHRLLAMRRSGILVTTRNLRYRTRQIRMPDGTTFEDTTAKEKGIDLRLGLDVVRMAYHGDLDVAVIFSQDQDLAEVAMEIRDIARTLNVWLKVVSAFPYGPAATVKRGIDKTDWFRMDRTFYDACTDPREYGPSRSPR